MTETLPGAGSASTDDPTPTADGTEAVVLAQALFQGRREIIIEHEGIRYRLRITRRGKLILQK